MRFKEFIEEAINPNKGTSIRGNEKFQQLIQSQFSQAVEKYKTGICIYRGQANKHRETEEPIKYADYTLFDAAKRKSRQSANTSNFYTLLLDSGNVPNWKMPSRSLGIIASSSLTKTETYGEPFVVLPINGAIIGVCPYNDIWVSFNGADICENLGQFNDFLNFIADYHNTRLNQKNVSKLIEQLQHIRLRGWDGRVIPAIKNYFVNYTLIKEPPDKYISKDMKTLYDFAIDFLSKPRLPFKTFTMNNYNIASSTGGIMGHEVWTDATCILVKKKIMDEFVGNS